MKALNTWTTNSTTPATRKARHDKDNDSQIDYVLGRTHNEANITILESDIGDAVSDHMLLTLTWTPQSEEGPDIKEYDEARRYHMLRQDEQDTKYATYADRRRMPKHFSQTALQQEAAGMRCDADDAFAHNIDRISEDMYDAATRAHREERGATNTDDDRRRRERWRRIRELIQQRNDTTDAEARRAPAKEVDRKRRETRRGEATRETQELRADPTTTEQHDLIGHGRMTSTTHPRDEFTKLLEHHQKMYRTSDGAGMSRALARMASDTIASRIDGRVGPPLTVQAEDLARVARGIKASAGRRWHAG